MAVLDPENRIVRCNEALAELLGYSMVELEGRPSRMLIDPRDETASGEMLSRLIKREQDQYRMIKRYIRKTGDALTVEAALTSVVSEAGQVDFVVVTLVPHLSQDRSRRSDSRDIEKKSGFAWLSIVENWKPISAVVALLGALALGIAEAIKSWFSK